MLESVDRAIVLYMNLYLLLFVHESIWNKEVVVSAVVCGDLPNENIWASRPKCVIIYVDDI